MPRAILVGMLCACIFLSGCYVSRKPQIVLRMRPDRRADVEKVRFDGEYRLLAATTEGRGFLKATGEPISTVKLVQGQRLGFERTSDSAIAIGGDTRVPISRDGAYVWEMRAVPGQLDGQKTSILVVITVGIIVGIVAATAAAATSGSFGFVSI